ncbi:MAG TPA: glycerol kinase GlpK [Terriglobales bacterium]|nr:glycerol kinase GlpK [Terriglobales bacterium]
MPERYILAIDQGTTNTKGLLVNRSGKPMFGASAPVHIANPQPDWVEQDPLEIWGSVLSVVNQCVAKIPDKKIDGIGISNQRETVLVWERETGKALAPAIVWQCRRSANICASLKREGHEAMLRERTGLGIDPLFSASKLAWLMDSVPGLRKRAENGEVCAGTVDSWLIWNLTGGAAHQCDVTNASRTQLFDIYRQAWDNELLSLFSVPKKVLPEVMPSSSIFGTTAAVSSLTAGIPIASAIGDSHAAMVGHGSCSPGTIKATYGTGSSLMTLVPEPKPASHKLVSTIAWALPCHTQYALEGNITMTGAALQWVGELLGLKDPIQDAISLSETVADAGGTYLVPAMVGLGAPYWDQSVRGAILGLTRSSSAAHLARAAVEAIAYQVRDVFEAMQIEAECELPILQADGGGSRNDRLMQFQADILGRPVVRSTCADLSALGAAGLAGLAIGYWPSIPSFGDLITSGEKFCPRMSDEERARHYDGWLRSVAQARFPHATKACTD